MKTVLELLSSKDRELLALFYGTDTHKALVKLIDLTQDNAAHKSIKAVDFLEVKQLQGQDFALESLKNLIRGNYKAKDKKG